MNVFAVFTLHPLDSVAWVENGCSYVKTDADGTLMRGEVVGDRIAVLRMTLGGALRAEAEHTATETGGTWIEFNSPGGFPPHSDCYDALRTQTLSKETQ